jgi:hypothetical protein
MNSKKKQRKKKKREQDNKHCATHMHENEKEIRLKKNEKIIIHRIIKIMIMMKTNDNHEDVFFLLIDFEYPSTRKRRHNLKEKNEIDLPVDV